MSVRHLVVLSLAMLWSGAALAQSQPGGTSETGTLINRGAAQIHGESRADARLTSKRFGECSVARAPVAVLNLIDLPVDTKDYERKMFRVVDDECLSVGELRLPWQIIRGAIFEALYVKEFGRAAPQSLKDVAIFDYASAYSRPLSQQAQSVVGLAFVGDCVARTAPVASHEFLTSIPGSGLEDRAFAVVARILPGCIPPNQTFKFSRSVVRSPIAEAMYRLSSVARVQRKPGS